MKNMVPLGPCRGNMEGLLCIMAVFWELNFLAATKGGNIRVPKVQVSTRSFRNVVQITNVCWSEEAAFHSAEEGL